jgi:hypothetical protein
MSVPTYESALVLAYDSAAAQSVYRSTAAKL